MLKTSLCINCKKRPIYIKKRRLCITCYQKLKRDSDFKLKDDDDGLCRTTKIKRAHLKEIEFIRNYFNHNNWIYQPALFRFNGEKYSPDFYDSERNVFIEVSGSRQAYHYSKVKYEEFRKYYPKINFEIRQPDGSLLNEEDRNKNWNNGNNLTVEV